MTSSAEEPPTCLTDLMIDMAERISPHIEHIKFLRGHDKHEGWRIAPDRDGLSRFQCGCGEWLDDKEEAENT